MAKPIANSERINVFLTPKILEALQKDAEKKGLTVSALVRMIVMEYVDNQSK